MFRFQRPSLEIIDVELVIRDLANSVSVKDTVT